MESQRPEAGARAVPRCPTLKIIDDKEGERERDKERDGERSERASRSLSSRL